MEDKLAALDYETPTLESLYLCPVVQGGASQFGEEADDPNTHYNKEDEGMD